LRILLATLGSRGDVEPFVHLGRRALAAGHSVLLASPDQADLPTDGLDVVSLGVRFSDLAPGPGTSPGRAFREHIRPAMSRALAAFVDAGLAWGPDIIVAHPKVLTASALAAHLTVPHLVVELTPTLTPTGEFPAAGIASGSLGSVLNRLSYRAVGLAGSLFAADRRAACERLGVDLRQLPAPSASLVAVSPSLLRRPADWPPTAHITGDWSSPATGTADDPTLSAFIEADAPFLYAGFGSMVGGDAAARAEAIIGGARSAGLRAVIATGWGGLTPPTRSLGADVFVAESVPHASVLPRAVAAIHHGGAGTTHAVARAGVPSIVVPFLADQPFWAALLRRRGLAPAPLPRNALTSPLVRDAIRAAVQCAPAARDVAKAMRDEDGTGAALHLIVEHARRIHENE